MGQVIAVVGASRDRGRFSNKAVRAWRKKGWTVVPVHPKLEEIEGLKAYPRVTDIPGPVDLANLYVPPQIGLGVLDELVAKGIGRLYVNPGAGSDELMERAKELGLEAIPECSIRAIGEDPGAY